MAVYLVAGGAGFIGSNIAATLVADGETVRVYDDLSSGYLSNLDGVDAQFIEGDIRDEAAMTAALQGCDYVLHLAAIPSVVRSVDEPRFTHDVNANGTLNLLECARQAGVKRVVFAGSSAVYGDSPELPKTEAMQPEPLSPYALHKLCGEYYGRLYTQLFGLEVVTVRYFNVYGPRQDPGSDYAAVIPKFISLMLAGRQPTIFGDGLQTRDFCFVEDVAQASLLACRTPGVAGNTYNVACGDRITLLDLVDTLNQVLGTDLAAVHTDPRPGDIEHSYADITEIQRELGFAAAVDFAEGLRRTVAFYRETKAA